MIDLDDMANVGDAVTAQGMVEEGRIPTQSAVARLATDKRITAADVAEALVDALEQQTDLSPDWMFVATGAGDIEIIEPGGQFFRASLDEER